MKKGWSRTRLSDISDISYGYTEKTSFENIGPKFLRITDIQNNSINWNNVPYCKIEDQKYEKYQLGKDDILFARTGATTGKSIRIVDPPESVFASYLIRVKLVNRNVLNAQFLAYFFQTAEYWQIIEKGTSGSAQGGFNATKLGAFLIPIPPLDEQQRIVQKLDAAFAAIDQAITNTEKNLENVNEFYQSKIDDLFSYNSKWVKSELSKNVKFIDYRGRTPKKVKEGLRLITAKNVKNGYLQIEPQEFVEPDIYESWMTRGIPRKGDVLFTSEAPLANVAQLDTDEKVVFSQRIIILQPDTKLLLQTFLKYLLLSNPIRADIFQKGTGATVKGIKAQLLKKIEIYFPKEINEQLYIIKKMDNISEKIVELEKLYQTKLIDLQELKQSILQKAFQGEL